MALDKKHKMEKIIEIYSDLRDELNKKYIDENQSGVISDKQKANFASMEEIDDMIEKLRKEVAPLKKKTKLTQKDISRLRAYVVFSMLRSLPTRNDMAGMKYISQTDYKQLSNEEKQDHNYLVNERDNLKFIYNLYKTSKKYGENIIPAPQELKPILRMYLKMMDYDYGDTIFPMTRNALSQLLLKQSQRLIDKKISTTMMRKIYLSDKYADIKEEQDALAKVMGHSKGTAQAVYVKKQE
jgi:integrase